MITNQPKKEKLIPGQGFTITVASKKPWEVARGHCARQPGAGAHVPKPRKGHRGDKARKAIKEFD